LIAYFNDDIKNKYAKDFCDLYQLKNLIKGPTGFKNPENPTTIDLMLTNSRTAFVILVALRQVYQIFIG